MGSQVSSIIGSGTLQATRNILSPIQRGAQSGGEGIRYGSQVIIGNPEEITSIDCFMVSGITVGTTPIKVFGASQTPLPRTRMLKIENGTDSSTLFIAHDPSKVVSEGWQLVNGAGTIGPRATIDLPLMAGAEVWVAAAASTISVKMIMF